MSTDGVIFADFVEFRGHLHLEWQCPDCGRIGRVGFREFEEGGESFRSVCSVTGREFIVVSCSIPSAECDDGS